jgi:predicted nucleic acid-binding protein
MKIFIDTAPFIYLIEGNPKYVSKIKSYFSNRFTDGDELVTSVITLSEFGVKPKKENKEEIIAQFESFLSKAGIPFIEVNKTHAEKAYELRAKYKFLKGMDALQIGIAIESKCDQFLTNDAKLEKIVEIKVILVENL